MGEVLVKMCGFTRPEDARVAVAEGAALIGLIFVPASPRRVSEGAARSIVDEVRSVSDSARVAGVFVDETPEVINRLVATLGLDLVQLHGDEPEDFESALDVPVIRAVRVRDAARPAPAGAYEWILYDTWVPETRGGSGKVFDWALLDQIRREHKLMLSGGLHPGNVREAIDRVHPEAVDVASGIEGSPGVKNHEKIRAFMKEVRNG